MKNLTDMPHEVQWAAYSYLDPKSLARMVLTEQNSSARGYVQYLLSARKLQELGHAYTQDGQHAGVAQWQQIRDTQTDALETQRVTAPTLANVLFLCRLMHEGDVKRYP